MKEDITGIQAQLNKRSSSKIKIDQLDIIDSKALSNVLLLSQSDLGVVRNGGRRGSAYGPKAILNTLLKMTAHKQRASAYKSIREQNSSKSFNDQQAEDIATISKVAKETEANLWHLGGGHDHIYPFLKAIDSTSKNILVINLDAHLDTRVDPLFHSGTPFRQFANEAKGHFKIIQLGIHDFANEESNYKELKNSEMEVYTVSQLRRETSNYTTTAQFLDTLTKNYSGYTIVLSLDCDAISSESMEAVSAVNHNGLQISFVRDIFSWYYSLPQARKFCGIYEYNPIFDNLSSKGSRTIASLIGPFL